MLRKLIWATILVLAIPVVGQAGELGISFSDQTAQLAFSQQVAYYDGGRAVFGLRGLYNDRKDTELLSVSYEVFGPTAIAGLEMGAGARGYHANSNNEEIGTIGIGGLVRLVPPNLPQASFAGSMYLCPEVFSMLDGEGLWETELSASFEFARRAKVFATYTMIEADVENLGDRTLDKTFRVGLGLGF